MPTSRSRIGNLARAAALVPALSCCPALADTPAAVSSLLPAVSPAPVDELLLLVIVNGQRADSAELVLRSADGRSWMTEEGVAQWRLTALRATSAARIFAGVRYRPLDALAHTRVTFDPRGALLRIDAPPEAFGATTLPWPQRALARPASPPPGGFLNYEFFASHASGEDAFAGTFEGGWFTSNGVFVTSVVAASNTPGRNVVRLDSTYTRDFPAQLATLRVGDAISVPGAWAGRSASAASSMRPTSRPSPDSSRFPSSAPADRPRCRRRWTSSSTMRSSRSETFRQDRSRSRNCRRRAAADRCRSSCAIFSDASR